MSTVRLAQVVGIAIVAAFVVSALAGCGEGAGAGNPSGAAVSRADTDVVFSVAFSGDGRTLASVIGTEDAEQQTIRLWDVRTRKPLGAPLTGYSAIGAILFSPRKHTLVYPKGDRIRLLDVRTGEQIALLRGHRGEVSGIALSGDGHTLASTDGATIRLWDFRKHRQVGAPIVPKLLDDPDIALSPDGRTLAYPDKKAVRLLDTRTRRQLLPPLQGKNLEVVTVSFSRDGRTLLANGWYDESRLWDVRTHKQIGKVLPTDFSTASVELSPDGRTLAYTDRDAIRLLDIRTRKAIGAPLKGHNGPVVSIAFSPDARTLASGDADSTVRLWDVRSGKALAAMR